MAIGRVKRDDDDGLAGGGSGPAEVEVAGQPIYD